MSDTVEIVFQKPDGERIVVAAKSGSSVMEAAIMNNVPGIDAECGGACICATCHVYCDFIDDGLLGEMRLDEDDMLDMSRVERRPSSRLACQIRVSQALQSSVFLLPGEAS